MHIELYVPCWAAVLLVNESLGRDIDTVLSCEAFSKGAWTELYVPCWALILLVNEILSI